LTGLAFSEFFTEAEPPNIFLTRFEGFSTIAPCFGILMRL
jgi:hypothetical protein